MPELAQRITADRTQSESVWLPVGSSSGTILQETTRITARSVSRGLAMSSPLYNRLVEAIVDAVFAPGTVARFTGDADEPFVTALKWLWEDGPSALKHHGRGLLKTLIIDGELILKPFVNEADGRIALDILDPECVTEVTQGYGLKAIKSFVYEEGLNGKRVELKVIQRPLVKLSDLSGDAFFFRLFPPGYTATPLRGMPLLIACLDHISSLTEFAYRRITILSRLATFYWEVVLEGMTQDQINTWLSGPQATPPEGGEIFAHNERVKWDVVVPSISDISDESRFWMQMLAGSIGLTPEFLGQSSSRDITSESIFTALMHLNSLQDEFFSIFHFITLYALEQAARRSMRSRKIPEFKIATTTPGSRSMQRAASSIRLLSESLGSAVKQGLITNDEAKQILRGALAQLGFTESGPEWE